ncbi:hypothetical protein [Streptomyces litchfieldiae]|uniref:Lipoprotein n=1 Tax=Streptomyces litchfieldiae TaxID=3075543 RepID=A0ABU2MX73_9ACTN|nr:hypothetical protein [Streptomyces sp. DSM 44938]MDT0345159.1 hypothetical protein [Streptomyces sp. DSM 44938]
MTRRVRATAAAIAALALALALSACGREPTTERHRDAGGMAYDDTRLPDVADAWQGSDAQRGWETGDLPPPDAEQQPAADVDEPARRGGPHRPTPTDLIEAVSDDGRTVTLRVPHGACDSGIHVEVLETDTSVVFGALIGDPQGPDESCTEQGLYALPVVELAEPLGERAPLDAYTGELLRYAEEWRSALRLREVAGAWEGSDAQRRWAAGETPPPPGSDEPPLGAPVDAVEDDGGENHPEPLDLIESVSDNGRTVTVRSGVGGCDDAIDVEVLETGTAVVFGAFDVAGVGERDPDRICTTVVVPINTEIELERPLGERAPLDAYTGRVLPRQEP